MPFASEQKANIDSEGQINIIIAYQCYGICIFEKKKKNVHKTKCRSHNL